MRKYITIYYLLCVLLILGAFAAMAQNNYGLVLLGFVAAAFSLVFLVQLMSYLDKHKQNYDFMILTEHVSLILISAILSLRTFYIRFPFVEELFILSAILLAGVFSWRLINNYKSNLIKNKILAWSVLFFHASIILYVVSMALAPLYPPLSEPAGILAFLFLILFVISAVVNKTILIEGENRTIFDYVNRFKDHSIILIAVFVIFTSYMGLTKFRIVPKMFTDEYPQAYFKLVQEAELGVEQPINGKYKYEDFKEKYDQFISRNLSSDQK